MILLGFVYTLFFLEKKAIFAKVNKKIYFCVLFCKIEGEFYRFFVLFLEFKNEAGQKNEKNAFFCFFLWFFFDFCRNLPVDDFQK